MVEPPLWRTVITPVKFRPEFIFNDCINLDFDFFKKNQVANLLRNRFPEETGL